MATIAFDSSGARDAARPPISLHPAFPAVVALWFAALLGLGSLVLPVVLLERIVDAIGIAAIIPSADPPLGFMARGLIALASAIAGSVVGVAVARRVASVQDSDRPSRVVKFASGARRPISVNEELGGEGLINGFGLPVNRRRALAIAEDDRPSDFLYTVPLPGSDEDDYELAFEERPLARTGADEPLELSNSFEHFAEDCNEPEAAAHDEDEPTNFEQEWPTYPPKPQAGLQRQELEVGPDNTEKADGEPLPFSAPSLARRAAQVDTRAPAPEPVPHEPAPAASEPQPFRGDWSSAPVDEPGLVQLVQRLGASLERRRAWLASAAAAAPAPLPAPAGFDPAPAEDAAQAIAAYFSKPNGEAPVAPDAAVDAEAEAEVFAQPPSSAPADQAARPNPLRSWHVADNEDDLDAMPSFTLPLRQTVSPTIAFDEPEKPEAAKSDEENEDADPGEADGSYSSLLAMRNPFAQKDNGFVRIEEPERDDDAVKPAVVFPGRSETAFALPETGGAVPRPFDPPADCNAAPPAGSHAAPVDTEAALRAALATLQRMSGTA